MIEKARFPAHPGTNFYSDPEIFVFKDAIYAPGLNHFDNLMGVFTREGYLEGSKNSLVLSSAL